MDEKEMQQIQRELKIRKVVIITFVSLAIIGLIAFVSLYISKKQFRKWIDINLLRKSVTTEDVASIDLDANKNNQIFCYDKFITILNDKNLKIYNQYGEVVQELAIDVNTAIFSSSDKYLAIAEKSGQELAIVLEKNLLWREKVDGEILQININKNGYVALVTTDTTYKSIITLYSSDGKSIFKKYLSTTRVEDVAISNDNKYLAYSEIDISGAIVQSNINILSVENAKKSGDEATYYEHKSDPSKMIVKLKYQDKGKLLCEYDNSIDLIDNKSETNIIQIDESTTFASVNLNNSVAYITEENKGIFNTDSTLNIINTQNNQKFTYSFDEITKEMYAYGNVIGINIGTEVYFVNTNGILVKEYISKQEITKVILSNQIALAVYKDRVEIINL